jgi:hypothetical protein
MREAVEIELHHIINREDGFSISRSGKPIICYLREWIQASTENVSFARGL